MTALSQNVGDSFGRFVWDRLWNSWNLLKLFNFFVIIIFTSPIKQKLTEFKMLLHSHLKLAPWLQMYHDKWAINFILSEIIWNLSIYGNYPIFLWLIFIDVYWIHSDLISCLVVDKRFLEICQLIVTIPFFMINFYRRWLNTLRLDILSCCWIDVMGQAIFGDLSIYSENVLTFILNNLMIKNG